MPILSVIVPIYNTGKYLRDALQSVIQQDIQDMEIICVNDGSTDDSLSILEDMAREDSRIKIYSQENQGQSVARNTAMAHATGTYIYFMDSDDLLKPGCFKTCLNYIEKHGFDFVFFDGEVFCEEGTPSLGWGYDRTGIYEEGKAYEGPQLMQSLLDNFTHRAVPWLLFVRHEQIKNLSLSFYPGIIHEDELYTTLLTIQSSRIGCLKQSFVRHRVRANSTMTNHYSRRNVDCYLVVVDELFRWANSHPEHLLLIKKYARYTLDIVFYTATSLPLHDKWALMRILKEKRYTQFVTFKNTIRFLLKR